MQRRGTRRVLLGVMLTISLAAMGAWVQTAPGKGKLERLKIAVAPLGWDTNFTWLQSRSGQRDKLPALEYLMRIDRNTRGYISELAEKWDMAADGNDCAGAL